MTDTPPEAKTTTVRLPHELHQRVAAAATADHRTFNSEVITLLEVALAGRAPEKAGRK